MQLKEGMKVRIFSYDVDGNVSKFKRGHKDYRVNKIINGGKMYLLERKGYVTAFSEWDIYHLIEAGCLKAA